jgi:hypothetical protein
MSSGWHGASSSACATKPKAREIGSTGYAGPTQHSSFIGHYAMATTEHREPYQSRGSVRFWERPEVKLLRATRQSRRQSASPASSAYPPTSIDLVTSLLMRLRSFSSSRSAVRRDALRLSAGDYLAAAASLEFAPSQERNGPSGRPRRTGGR